MKKVVFISSPHFADCDIPLLKELQKFTDVTYILKISEQTKNMTLIHIKNIKEHGGLYPATDFPEIRYLSKYIDISKMYILNFPGKHDMSLCNLIAVLKMIIFIIKKKIDIIHLTWPPRHGEFFIYALYKKIILTVHDPIPHSNNDNWKDRIHRKIAFSFIRRFILLNKKQKDEFIKKYKINNKKIYHSRLSIYTHLIDIIPIYPQIEGSYILFFGSINKYKGLSYLCQAIKIANEKGNTIKLIIAGKGNIDFDISPYIKTGNIIFINRYIKDEELVGLIKGSKFVVCPYIDATQSGVIMSSFALNTPVIATNTGALTEMVINNKHGLIVQPKDVEDLSQAILSLWHNNNKIHIFSDNIKRDYSQDIYSWHNIAKGINSIYHS